MPLFKTPLLSMIGLLKNGDGMLSPQMVLNAVESASIAGCVKLKQMKYGSLFSCLKNENDDSGPVVFCCNR